MMTMISPLNITYSNYHIQIVSHKSLSSTAITSIFDFGNDGSNMFGLDPALHHIDHDSKGVLVDSTFEETTDLINIFECLEGFLVAKGVWAAHLACVLMFYDSEI